MLSNVDISGRAKLGNMKLAGFFLVMPKFVGIFCQGCGRAPVAGKSQSTPLWVIHTFFFFLVMIRIHKCNVLLTDGLLYPG